MSYIVNAIHVPKWVTQQIQKMFCKFMWDYKIPLIKYATIIGGEGGDIVGGLISKTYHWKNCFSLKIIKEIF